MLITKVEHYKVNISDRDSANNNVPGNELIDPPLYTDMCMVIF